MWGCKPFPLLHNNANKWKQHLKLQNDDEQNVEMSGSEYANANVYVSFIVNFNGVDDYNIIYCVFRGEYANVNINLNGVDN